MASVAKQTSVGILFLLFNLIDYFNAESVHSPVISPKLVTISDQWQKQGLVHQEKHIKEVIVERGLEHLYLVCSIEPNLPLTEEHFHMRNELVKFEKIYPEKYVVYGRRYWSDDQDLTAVALDMGNMTLFGTYACSYGHVKQTVEVLAKSIDVFNDLPSPRTFEEMFSFSFVKRKSAMEFDTMPVPGKNKVFHCPNIQPDLGAMSVHRLKPADISTVATIGDSMMVGLGAKANSLSQFFTEYRGVSWSNGGDLSVDEVITLPNILRKFNPDLKGFSTSVGRHFDSTSGLNMARVFTKTRNLQEQARGLVDRMKKEDNFEEGWKVVTIMTGTRDLCRFCHEQGISPDEYIESLMNTLEILQRDLPKTYVNLVLPMNVTRLETFYRKGDCLIRNWSICPCLSDKVMRDKISSILHGYKKLVYELIESGLYERKDDFTVVVQPVFEAEQFFMDRDLFSLDCLHLSSKGNGEAATVLWNSMIAFKEERSKVSQYNPIKCLKKNYPYFFTHKNSKDSSSPDRSPHNASGDKRMNDGIIAVIALSTICVLSVIVAFIYVKHKLRITANRSRLKSSTIIKYRI